MLVELISRPAAPTIGGSSVPPEGSSRGGSSVSNPATWGPAAARSSGGLNGRPEWHVPAMLFGAGIVVIVAALLIGYQIGQKKEKQDWAKTASGGSGPDGMSGPAVKDPLKQPKTEDPNAALGGGVVKGPTEVKPPPPAPVEVQLQDGWNYLVVASLRRAEAEEAATYLKDNGLPVKLMPVETSGVDRGGSGANNGRWQLWILRGVPSGEYQQRRAEREALEAKVNALGRAWKAQNRKAPTDFGSVYWNRYKSN